MRPNRLSFRYAGLKYILERRGAREDSTALPVDARTNPTILRWMKMGVLEEITQEDYIELSVRITDEDIRENLAKAFKPNLPMGDYNAEIDMKMPYVIPKAHLDDEKFKQENMSPRIEWTKPPISTSEELAKKRGRPKKQ